MNEITVIDALMGQGKTKNRIAYMNANPNQKFIYIGVNLGEVERIQQACPALDMRDPIPRHGRKYWDLIELVRQGHNIVATHQLFRLMTVDLSNVLRDKGYTLIIDEALDVVEKYPVGKAELELFLEQGMVYVDEKKHLRWNHDRYPNYAKLDRDARYKDLPGLCDNGNLVKTRDGVLIWQFPASFLGVFKEVFICTYMFEGQVMADYFKASGVQYNLRTLKDGELVDFGDVNNTIQKVKLAALIHVDMDPYRNEVGRKIGRGYPLTETWFSNHVKKRGSDLGKRLKNNTEAFFKTFGHGVDGNMWTTFDKHKKKLNGVRYSRYDKCFVPMNTKATDKWKHKSALAYLVDRWQSPIVAGYFEDMNIPTRADLFALTELIQWIWRSRIRKQPAEPIQLFLPSERMRSILTNWIVHSDAKIVAGQRLDVGLGNAEKDFQREAA